MGIEARTGANEYHGRLVFYRSLRPSGTTYQSQRCWVLNCLSGLPNPGDGKGRFLVDVTHPLYLVTAFLVAILLDANGINKKIRLMAVIVMMLFDRQRTWRILEALQLDQPSQCVAQVVSHEKCLSVDDEGVRWLVVSPNVRESNVWWASRDVECLQRVLYSRVGLSYDLK